MNRFRNHHETPHARVIDTRGSKQLANKQIGETLNHRNRTGYGLGA
jgi:hypothetical protein